MEEVEHDDIKKDYIVRDASSSVRPAWIEDAKLWASQFGRASDELYFSFETEPKVTRELACDFAKANLRAQIAGDISSDINQTVSTALEAENGSSALNTDVKSVKEYMETTLVQKVQGKLIGTEIEKTYWEKRNYQKKLGSVRDFDGFTCAILVKMRKDDFTALVNIVREDLSSRIKNETLKDKVDLAVQAMSAPVATN